MKKITQIFFCLSFAMAVNLLCINNATAEDDIDSATIATSNQNENATIEIYNYEDVENLSEELITSKDKIYTEQN